MVDLSALFQLLDEGVKAFLSRFKIARFKCKILLPKKEYVSLAMNGLNYELNKMFHGIEYRDLFELSAKSA